MSNEPTQSDQTRVTTTEKNNANESDMLTCLKWLKMENNFRERAGALQMDLTVKDLRTFHPVSFDQFVRDSQRFSVLLLPTLPESSGRGGRNGQHTRRDASGW